MNLTEQAELYHHQLLNHPPGLQWHYNRGLTHDTITRHRLGWITDPATREARWALDRPVIPYWTMRGGCVELKARTGQKAGPKYLKIGNAFPLPTKTRLFNALQAMPSPRNAEVLIVEGEYDCLIALQAGYRATAVAGVQGWNTTWEHLYQDSRVVLVFDGDEAGAEAADKLTAALDRRGIDCRTVRLPEGRDLTDLWLEGGRQRVKGVIG